MSYELRDFSDVAPATTVSSGITNVDTTVTLVSGTGYPSGGASGDFMIQIESEIIRCSSRTGNSLTVSGGVAGRGQNGTAAAAHLAGTTVNHVHTAINDSKEANRAVAKTIGVVTTSQDLLVADVANSFTRLPVGTNGQILQVLAGAVAYAALPAGSVTAGKIGAGGISASNQFAAGVVDSTAILDGTIVNADINAAAAIANTKLATNPLARANHTGTQLAATVSDFDTQVRTSRLDQMAAPTANVSMNTHKITSVTDPTAAQDAGTKNYIDLYNFVNNQSLTLLTTTALAAGTTVIRLDVADPGYNIEFFGTGMVICNPVTQLDTGNVWSFQAYVNGNLICGLDIPILINTQSTATPIRRFTANTGTGTGTAGANRFELKLSRVAGSQASLTLTDNGFFQVLDVWTRKL